MQNKTAIITHAISIHNITEYGERQYAIIPIKNGFTLVDFSQDEGSAVFIWEDNNGAYTEGHIYQILMDAWQDEEYSREFAISIMAHLPQLDFNLH